MGSSSLLIQLHNKTKLRNCEVIEVLDGVKSSTNQLPYPIVLHQIFIFLFKIRYFISLNLVLNFRQFAL